MIHFRYHLISIVAVFLALGIGIVMGSTVIDKAIVNGLENRIDSAERNSIERKQENDELRKAISSQDSQDTVLAGHSVRGYLPNQTVFVLVIGNVSENTIVETRELLAVSGARLGSEIIINEDFAKSDKALISNELSKIEGVLALGAIEKDKNSLTANVLLANQNQKAGNQNATPVAIAEVQATFDKYNAFKEQEVSQTIEPVQPVSFILLVNRKDLDNKNVQSFVGGFISTFSTTVGFEGSETDSPSRTQSIVKFSRQLPSWMVVDNVESPSGRAAMVIAHARALAGERTVYGVSSKASSPAPELTTP